LARKKTSYLNLFKQPRSHLFDKKIWKFIGSTIDEQVTNIGNNSLIKEQKFSDILNKFEIAETKTNILEDQKNQFLIFVSLGTLFNNNFIIYKKIIDAFETFDLECEEETGFKKIKLENLTVRVIFESRNNIRLYLILYSSYIRLSFR
jgi:hypothetical protein